MNTIPGSPVAHAVFAIISSIILALTFFVFLPVLGFISQYSLLLIAACINSSVAPTDKLKLANLFSFFLDLINAAMSGWLEYIIPMFAPLLFPPCLITSVVLLNISINERGPDAVPFVFLTVSPFGLILLKLKPVPPPLCWIKAMVSIPLNMLFSESSMGITKHAANCPSSVPAFISVGLFGRNSRLVIAL